MRGVIVKGGDEKAIKLMLRENSIRPEYYTDKQVPRLRQKIHFYPLRENI